MRSDGPPAAALRMDADLAVLAEVRQFVRDRAGLLGADTEAIGDLVQAVDECVTNIIRHGYGGHGGPIEIDLDRDGPELVVRVRDAAPLFDPADAPAFDPLTPLARRRPGGMGVHLMRELTSSLEHRPLPGGGNEVTMRRACRSTEGGGNA